MAIYLREESVRIIEDPVVLKCIHNIRITKVLPRKVIEDTKEFFREIYAKGWRCERSHDKVLSTDLEIRSR